MSTDYTITSATEAQAAEGGRLGGELSVLEHSGRFDLDVDSPAVEQLVTVARCVDVEIGLRILQVVLYNCGDPDVFRRWLHIRVNEVDSSGARTPCPG